MLIFYLDLFLFGWVSVQEPIFFFRKSICTTHRCVVKIFRQHIFWRGKTKPRKERIEKKFASGFITLPGREVEYGTTSSGLVHWCVCTLAATGIASHTLQVTALEFSPQRKRQYTPWKLKPWNSVLNASGSGNVLIIRIIIHGFRHSGDLRVHPRCCHRLCVESNRWPR